MGAACTVQSASSVAPRGAAGVNSAARSLPVAHVSGALLRWNAKASQMAAAGDWRDLAAAQQQPAAADGTGQGTDEGGAGDDKSSGSRVGPSSATIVMLTPASAYYFGHVWMLFLRVTATAAASQAATAAAQVDAPLPPSQALMRRDDCLAVKAYYGRLMGTQASQRRQRDRQALLW